MTRANVLFFGLLTLLLGAVGYGAFRVIGLEDASAGIAAESILILIVFGWTCSYLLRVVTGKMTFNEQRKRYREEYEKVTTAELERRFQSMSDEQRTTLLAELEKEKTIGDDSSKQ